MKVVKLLERKEVIRLFGGGLMLAPLFNSYLTYLALKSTPGLAGLSSSAGYWKVVLSGTGAQHTLDIASIVIGGLLLTGLRTAWKFMLVLIGGYMVMQVAHLGQNLRNNPLNGLFFIANVGLFLFIADQLAFKQKQAKPQPAAKSTTPRPAEKPIVAAVPAPIAKAEAPIVVQMRATPRPRPKKVPVRRSKAKIMVHFQDLGAWAQVVSISPAGIELRSSGPAPVDIESREVEMNLAPDLLVKARLKSRSGSFYFFEYTDLAPSRVPKLNQWLLAQAS